ncbi:Pyrrolidone-carboxylate peptidase [compost metagenome]
MVELDHWIGAFFRRLQLLELLMAKILVTGFRPFNNEAINPSEILLSEIKEVLSSDEVDTLLLPVSYQNSFAVLMSHLQQNSEYKAILMLGQAGGRDKISLERVALNWCESGPDEDGHQPAVGPILANAPAAHIADFFPTVWADILKEVAPTAVSSTAGTFVCNTLYFKVLNELKNKTNALFVHVPYLPEQAALKTKPTPSMPLADQFAVIKKLITLL